MNEPSGAKGIAFDRQVLIQIIRDICQSATELTKVRQHDAERAKSRATSIIQACLTAHRKIVRSHPELADELHILANEVQIALLFRLDDPVIEDRMRKIGEAIKRVQSAGAAM